jgi:hypothetical protein
MIIEFYPKGSLYMLRKIFPLAVAVLVAVIISGCARRIIVAEVLQQPLGKKIYLKNNVWYQTAGKSGKIEKMSCLNYQQGTIIPFGTEIEPVKASSSELSFKTMDGKTFTVDYEHSLTLLPMEAYIKNLFTMKNRQELTKGISKQDVELLMQGKIRRGMTKSQILLGFGVPAACRTPSTLNSTWVYWSSKDTVYRVVFRRNKVNAIVDISDKPKTLAKIRKVVIKAEKAKKNK